MAALQFVSSIRFLRHLQHQCWSQKVIARLCVPSPVTTFVRPIYRNQVMQYNSQPAPDNDIPLSKQKCVPCNTKDLRPMNEESARLLLEKVPGWDLINDDGCLKLTRSYKAKTFMKGLDFFKMIADVAEAEGHHPNLHLVNWNDVKLEIWTHAIGGLTENDFILAAKISELNAHDLLRKRVSGNSNSTNTS